MAGGIDWFRWHHGSVTDPKFALVARRAGTTLPNVLAVWTYVLEKASASEHRGEFGDLDDEAIDCLFGLDDGTTASILEHMQARDLIDHNSVKAWEKRQPKRERDSDETAAERKAAQRAREAEARAAAAKAAQVTPEAYASRHVTPSHATDGQVTPRGEESREEIEETRPLDASPSAPSSAEPTTPKTPSCPFDSIVALYHERLPMLPRVRLMTDDRKRKLAERWRWVMTSKRSDGTRRAETEAQGLEWLDEYFQMAAANDWLCGRTERSEAHKGWKADIEFVLSTKGLTQVIEKTNP